MLFLLLLISLGAAAPVRESAPPSLSIPSCSSGNATVDSLELASGSKAFPAATKVSVCWTPAALHLAYTARDDPFLRNDYRQCNTETWNQEVVELFIAPYTAGYATRYLEVELTPQNTLYVARIHNPFGNGTDKTNAMVGCAESGIEHHAALDTVNRSFEASISVPWTLVNNRSKLVAAGDAFVGNFFRVRMHTSVSICDPKSCDYGAWSPTFDVPPNFHVSRVFGKLVLLD